MSDDGIPRRDEFVPTYMVGTLVQTALEAPDVEKRRAAAAALVPEPDTYEQRRRVIEREFTDDDK